MSLSHRDASALRAIATLPFDGPWRRAAVVVGLAATLEGQAFIRGEPPLPYTGTEPKKESEMAPPPKSPASPVFTVRKDEKRMVLVQRTYSADVPLAKLLDLVRSTGADIPADAQVQVAWGDREDRPYLGRSDALTISWSRSEETVEH